ncbi:MAG: sugar phosphate nucleotidyltransferase [Candidatus Pacebacteria bacterium]|nr:sugar phosphate nucleotidyltransferase [Candidatus Paceibacterota bacterium]
MTEPKRAIITIAGLGTRFLPLSKLVPKELWPLADKPLLYYIVKEVIDSGIKEIVFVVRKENKEVVDYFKPDKKLEKLLVQRKENILLEEMKNLEELVKDVSISYVLQKSPLGDGHAVLQAITDEPTVVAFSDDIVESKSPVILQLKNVFKTSQKPVIALYPIKDEAKLSCYGVVKVEKIANKYYKIKEIIEKPKPSEAPSNLAIMGKYILTPDFFSVLKNTKANHKKEIILANALDNYLKLGKVVYGFEVEGKWLECGNKLDWLKSNLYTCLKHPFYSSEIKEFLKKEKLI